MELALKVQTAISQFNKERETLQAQYINDYNESLRIIQNLHQVNDRLSKDNNDKDRLIQQFRSNLSQMDDKLSELEKDRDRWRTEADLYKESEQKSIDGLRKTLENDTNNELQIKDIKEKIFKFLINERNSGADKIRVDFYKSIISLLVLAKDSEKDCSLDLKALMQYFTNEGK